MRKLAGGMQHLTGQDYVKKLSRQALEQIQLNHDHDYPYVEVDLKNQAKAEASVMRDYYGRYLFELLQNANDAITAAKEDSAWSKTSPYRVHIELMPTALIIANDGVPFLEKDVDSIYRWGVSSKDPNKSVGHKGIGFKSVLEITESPQIFSQVVQFHFDRKTCYRKVREVVGQNADLELPITRFVFPFDIKQLKDDRALVQHLLEQEAFATVIRLPLRRESRLVAERLETDLTPKLLLFLSGIDELTIQLPDRPRRMLAKVQAQLEQPDFLRDVILCENETHHSRWLLFEAPKRPIAERALLAELEDEAWSRVKHVGFTLALPINEDGSLRVDIDESEKLFVYFPTQQDSGLPFAIHGDFYVDVARKDIPERAYNTWLAEQIAIFVQKTIMPTLVSRFPGDSRVAHALLPLDDPGGFGSVVQQAIVKRLAFCAFVPVLNGTATTPDRVIFSPPGIKSHITQFRVLFPPQLVIGSSAERRIPQPELEGDLRLVNFLIQLGATRLSFATVFKSLDGRGPINSSEDYAAFYQFLWNWHERLTQEDREAFSHALQDYRCVVTDACEWIAPGPYLYHAKLRQETPPMPRGIRAKLVHPAAYDAGGQASATYKLLNTLIPAIRDYDAPDIITNAVMPVFEDRRFERLSVEERNEIYHYLFRYWQSRQEGGNVDVERVKGQVLVHARCSANRRKMQWRPISAVYLSEVWTDDLRLEDLYAEFDTVYFLDEIRGLDVPAESRSTWKRFWQWLGGAIVPRMLVAETANPRSGQQQQVHGGTQLWEQYLRTIEYHYATCPTHGRGYRYLAQSQALEGFAELIEAGDDARLAILFEYLGSDWEQSYSGSGFSATMRCRRGACRRDHHTQKVPSFFEHLLRNVAWVPVQVGARKKRRFALAYPQECWFISNAESQVVRFVLQAPLAHLQKPEYASFCHAIGIRSADEAQLNDFVDMLRQLPRNFPDPNERISAGRKTIEVAAAFTRWVAERINNLLAQYSSQERPHLTEEIPPLVARNGDSFRYVHKPELVFFDDDKYQGRHWRHQLPFIPLDEGLRAAASYLEVKLLSEHLTEACTPGRRLEAESKTLERNFKAARPYVLALVNHQRPSMTDDVAQWLSTLQLEVVDGLVVHRGLNIEPGRLFDDVDAYTYLQQMTLPRTGSAGRAPKSGTLYVRKGHEDNSDLIAAPIAQYIDIPSLADAFVILLDRGGSAGRLRFLATRGLGEQQVQEMRTVLRTLGVQTEVEPDEGMSDWEQYLQKKLRQEQIEQVGVNPEPQSRESGKKSLDREEGPVEPDELPELDLTHIIVSSVDVERASLPVGAEQQLHLGRGSGGRPDWERNQRLKNRYGKRGEEVVRRVEIERLRNLGVPDPETKVRWLRDEGNEVADHDFDSLDWIDGQLVEIVIEVKATPVVDFRVSMSRQELACAAQYGERYRLYRVVNVASATPQVYIFDNPYTLWKAGKAVVEPRDAFVIFPDPNIDPRDERSVEPHVIPNSDNSEGLSNH